MTDEIRKIINDHARLPDDVFALAVDAHLYQVRSENCRSV
jgi:hypothetical protein